MKEAHRTAASFIGEVTQEATPRQASATRTETQNTQRTPPPTRPRQRQILQTALHAA
jgi:hypothetical protein